MQFTFAYEKLKFLVLPSIRLKLFVQENISSYFTVTFYFVLYFQLLKYQCICLMEQKLTAELNYIRIVLTLLVSHIILSKPFIDKKILKRFCICRYGPGQKIVLVTMFDPYFNGCIQICTTLCLQLFIYTSSITLLLIFT